MILRRFPLLNNLPLKALRAQGDVRYTIHRGVAKELLRRKPAEDEDVTGNDLLSRLSTPFLCRLTVRHSLTIVVASAHNSGSISIEELMDHVSRSPEIRCTYPSHDIVSNRSACSCNQRFLVSCTLPSTLTLYLKYGWLRNYRSDPLIRNLGAQSSPRYPNSVARGSNVLLPRFPVVRRSANAATILGCRHA